MGREVETLDQGDLTVVESQKGDLLAMEEISPLEEVREFQGYLNVAANPIKTKINKNSLRAWPPSRRHEESKVKQPGKYARRVT